MSRRGAGASARSLSSGSITPMEDEDDTPKRSTRGRNPLPPTTGPLFPPLPPKLPRPPKNSHPSKSPNAAAASATPTPADPKKEKGAAGQASGGREPGTSLTPPPTSEDVPVELDAEPGTGNRSGSGSGNGNGRRTGRASRKANATDSGAEKEVKDRVKVKLEYDPDAEVEVQVEDENLVESEPEAENEEAANVSGQVEEEDEDEGAVGTGAQSSSKLVPPEIIEEDLGTPGSETSLKRTKERTASARRRRGEDQLLLDDHLLPEEMRRTGKLAGKRGRESGGLDEPLKGNGHPSKKRGSISPRPVVETKKSATPAAQATMEKEAKQEVIENETAEVTTEADISEPPTEDVEQPEEAKRGDDLEVPEEEVELPEEDDEPEQEVEEEEDDDDGDDGGQEVTRCVCQREEGDPLMISCDKCAVWQHGPCMGIWSDDEAPDEYYCEQCRPDLHGPLRKWIRSKGRNIARFVPPIPEDLQELHNPHDKLPPSQSQRWLRPPYKKPVSAKQKTKETKEAKEASPPEAERRATSKRPEPVSKTSAKTEVSSRKPPSLHGRHVSIDAPSPNAVRDSQSPMNQVGREPKRRSTMNSRDAAFEEEQVRRAMEASKMEMGHSEERDEDALVEQASEVEKEVVKVVDVDQVEKEEEKKEERKNKGKRRRDDDDTDASPAPASKPKHPNQYTYRPKPSGPLAAPSPRRTQAGTPVPTPGPALHDHGTRRAGALANGAREAPFVAVQLDNLGWYLPDHLAQHSDLLPTSNPLPLSVRSPRQLANLPKSHFLNYRYGPFNISRDETGRLVLPTDGPEREVLGEGGETHTEPPARVRYPARRLTTAEMRKRVRGMLEYASRLQGEESKRAERKKDLGIPDAPKKERRRRSAHADENNDEGGEEEGEQKETNGVEDDDDAEEASRRSTATGPTAAELLAELTAQLVDFEETWVKGGFALVNGNGNGNGNGSGTGYVSPSIPASATFPSTSWPTSGLSKSVVPDSLADSPDLSEAPDAEKQEVEEQAEVNEEESGVEGGTEAEGEGSGDVDQDIQTEQDPQAVVDGDMVVEQIDPVDVYREGAVDEVLATQEEESVAKAIEAEVEAAEGPAADGEAEGEQGPVGLGITVPSDDTQAKAEDEVETTEGIEGDETEAQKATEVPTIEDQSAADQTEVPEPTTGTETVEVPPADAEMPGEEINDDAQADVSADDIALLAQLVTGESAKETDTVAPEAVLDPIVVEPTKGALPEAEPLPEASVLVETSKLGVADESIPIPDLADSTAAAAGADAPTAVGEDVVMDGQ